jgi:hypothetical protein
MGILLVYDVTDEKSFDSKPHLFLFSYLLGCNIKLLMDFVIRCENLVLKH